MEYTPIYSRDRLLAPVISRWPDLLLRWWKTEKFTATVIEFRTGDSSLSLQLDNPGDYAETIQEIYYTLGPQHQEGGATLRPLPESLAPFAGSAPNGGPIIVVPVRGGFEVMDGQLRLNTWLSEAPPIVIERKSQITTNLVPLAASFKGACSVFSDSTAMNLGLHFRLMDASGRRHEVEVELGTYAIEPRKLSFVSGSNSLAKIRLFPSPVTRWGRSEENVYMMVGTNWVQIAPMESMTDGKHWWRRIKNEGTDILLVCFGQPEFKINYSVEAVRQRP